MDSSTRFFSSTEAIRFGWRTTMTNIQPLLLLGIVGGFLSACHQALAAKDGGAPLLALGIQVLQAAVTLVLLRAALKLHDGERIDWARPGNLLVGFLPFLAAGALYGLIVMGGLLLFVIPGIYWAIKFGWATFVVADGDRDAIDALRVSSRLTQGVKGQLVSFALVVLGVNLLGALALGVGLLFTVPTTAIAAAYVFRRLQARATTLALSVTAPRPVHAT